MFQRITNLIKGMLDKGLSDAETPEILAEQAQASLQDDIKGLKAALVEGLTNEKLLEQQLKKSQQEQETAERHATTAVEAGNDDMAKQLLQKRQAAKTQGESVAEQLAQQKSATAALKERLSAVEHKYREFMTKKDGMIAKAKAGETMAKASALAGGSGNSEMDKWEQKINEKELRGQALGELNDTGGKVDEQFKKMSQDSQLDNELAALKAQMTGGGSDVKLIVDEQGAKKPVVDANVPMKRSDKGVGEENLPGVVDVEVVNSKDEDKK
jgi:phage shock protein A